MRRLVVAVITVLVLSVPVWAVDAAYYADVSMPDLAGYDAPDILPFSFGPITDFSNARWIRSGSIAGWPQTAGNFTFDYVLVQFDPTLNIYSIWFARSGQFQLTDGGFSANQALPFIGIRADSIWDYYPPYIYYVGYIVHQPVPHNDFARHSHFVIPASEFPFVRVSAPSQGNVTALATLLTQVSPMTNSDRYTAASWQGLRTAYNAARAVYNNPTSTQQQIDAAYTSLRNALSSLVLNQVTPPRPPIVGPGFAPPENVTQAVRTGDVLELIRPSLDLFIAHATSPMRVIIGIFAIVVSIRIIPKIFRMLLGFRQGGREL